VTTYPQHPFGFTIFCDDARREDTGKDILIGVYSGALVIARKPPVVIPQIICAVNYVEPKGTIDEAVRIQIFAPASNDPIVDRELIPRGRDEYSDPDEIEDDTMLCVVGRVILPLRALRVTEAGFLKVRLRAGGDTVLAGALQILFEENQSPNQQHSSR
jgi:hypothetical protein